jgi:hypothetical protein
MPVREQEIDEMTHEEIEAARRELQHILEQHEAKILKDVDATKALRELAKKVGASTQRVFFNNTVSGTKPVCNDAEIPELAYNIHLALQTASMIDACRTAAKNHEITLKAQESARLSQWISVAVMLAAVASAIAAWVATMRP